MSKRLFGARLGFPQGIAVLVGLLSCDGVARLSHLPVLAQEAALTQEAEAAVSPAAAATEAEAAAPQDSAANQDAAANPDAAGNEEMPSGDQASSVDAIVAGHSMHGETFNEGPRQAAVLMGGTGDVHFPVTSTVEQVQAFIDQGVGQLHGFWYLEAERSFRHAAWLDPQCAIAYWGCAMANINNAKRAKDFIVEADKLKEKCSPREQRYIQALHKYLHASTESRDDKRRRAEEYIGALEDIALDFPDDHEAKAFLIFSMWDARRDELGITSHLAVDALLEDLFAAAPHHPAHHYEIHLWDYKKPERALASSALCGPAAPAIAHMWHMPGHIYSRLHRYEDAVYQQEASARVDHAQQIRFALLPDEIHNYSHNNEWLVRNLSFIGRVSDGVALACNLIELPRHPKVNTIDGRGATGMGRERLYDLLNEHRLWETTLRLSETRYLEAQPDERRELERLLLIGSAAAMLDDTSRLASTREEINRRLEQVRTERETARSEALAKWQAEQTPAVAANSDSADSSAASQESTEATTQNSDETQEQSASSSDAPANGEPATNSETSASSETPSDAPGADEQARLAAEQERDKRVNEASKPFDDRIGRMERALKAIEGHEAWRAGDLPRAHELFADLNEVHESVRAEVKALAGHAEEGLKKLNEQVERRPGQIIPRAVLAWTLEQLGRDDEAIKALEGLRSTSSCFDLDAPLVARLESLVGKAGWKGDWRMAKEPATDLGPRPDLAELGPFRWTPPTAPAWSLTNSAGDPIASQDFQGKPTVVIFYLGAGCLHCVEQLKAFAPERQKFIEAGFEVIAISCEDEESLARSLKDYGDSMPIPLIADPELAAFRAYRCFDDFEELPLHGTFVIDAECRIRWRDIGPEPFMEVDFVLNEALRLLSFDSIDASLAAPLQDAQAPAGQAAPLPTSPSVTE